MAEQKVLVTKLIPRNDTKVNWETKNPVLMKGELAVEIDTRKTKFGDGVTAYKNLAYAGLTMDDLIAASATNDGLLTSAGFIKLRDIQAGATKVESSTTNGNIKINGVETKIYTLPSSFSASVITETTEKQFISKTQKDLLNDNLTYTNETPMVTALGGLSVGKTFDNVPLNELLTELLYPYTKPLVSISGSPTGVFEKGSTLSNISYSISVTKKSKPITSVKLLLNTVEKVVSGVTGNTQTLTYASNDASALSIRENTTIKAQISDGTSTVTSNSLSVSFVHPYYVGVLDSTISTPNETQVKSLTKKIQAKGNKTETFTCDNKRLVFAVPVGWTLKSIVDWNGFNITPSFTTNNVSVACLDGTTNVYTVYVSEPTSVAGKAINFNV